MLMAIPAGATVVIDTAALGVVIARDSGNTARSASSPSSSPAIDPFTLASPVLLVAILLLRGSRTRKPRPVIA